MVARACVDVAISVFKACATQAELELLADPNQDNIGKANAVQRYQHEQLSGMARASE